jgi:hypothetical protein
MYNNARRPIVERTLLLYVYVLLTLLVGYMYHVATIAAVFLQMQLPPTVACEVAAADGLRSALQSI